MRGFIVLLALLFLTSTASSQEPVSSVQAEFYPLFQEMRMWYRLEFKIREPERAATRHPDLKDRTDQQLVDEVLANELYETKCVLVQRGAEACPEIIAALPRASSERVYHCFIMILAAHDSSERDVAFREELRKFVHGRTPHQDTRFLPVLISTLAKAGTETDIELIEKVTAVPKDSHHLVACLAALGRCGENPEWTGKDPEPPQHKEYDPESNPPSSAQSLEILKELHRCRLFNIGYGPFELKEIRPNGGELPVPMGYMNHGRGGWSVEFGPMQGKLVPFYFEFVCGELYGEGAIGVVELKEGKWRMIFYQHLWVS